MSKGPVIAVETDALPIVRVIAISLKNAAKSPAISDRMIDLEGIMAFKSSVDKQAASVHFNLGNIIVERGVSRNSHITAELDVNRPISLGPEVTLHGDLEHQQFANDMRHIFNQHRTDWVDAAKDFWALYGNREGLPQALRAECTDDGRDVVLGKGSIQMRIVGSASALASVFNCSSMLVRSVIAGEIRAAGELKYLSTLTGVYFDRITGVLP